MPLDLDGSGLPIIGSEIVVVEGRGELLAVALADGHELWRLNVADGLAGIAVADSVVAASTVTGELFAVEASTGSLRWRVRPAGLPPNADSRLSIATDRVLAAFDDGTVAAFDATTGAEVWRSFLGSSDSPTELTAPVSDAAETAIGTGDGDLVVLESATGRTRFRRALGEPIGQPPVFAGRAVVAATDGGLLDASARDTGEPLWSFRGANRLSRLSVAPDFVVADDGIGPVAAFDPSDGTRRWIIPLRYGGVNIAGRSMVAIDGDGWVRLISVETREVQGCARQLFNLRGIAVTGDSVVAGAGGQLFRIDANSIRGRCPTEEPEDRPSRGRQPWPTEAVEVAVARADQGRTGSARGPALPASQKPVVVAREVDLPPLIKDDVALVPSFAGNVNVIDVTSGEHSGDLAARATATPSLVGSLALVPTRDGLDTFDLSSLEPVWAAPCAGGGTTSPLPVGDQVVVGCAGGEVIGVSAVDGVRRWKVQTLGLVASAPSTDGSLVFVGSDDGTVRALDLSGDERWTVQTRGAIRAAAIAHEGQVLVASLDGTISALDAGSGAVLWVSPTGAPVKHSMAADSESVWVVTGGALRRLSRESGRPTWDLRANPASGTFKPLSPGAYEESCLLCPLGRGPDTPSAAPVLMGGTLYQVTSFAALLALDPTTGQQQWRIDGIGRSPDDPAAADGVVLISAGDAVMFKPGSRSASATK